MFSIFFFLTLEYKQKSNMHRLRKQKLRSKHKYKKHDKIK
jgi:hypothetical protein